uniref:Zasp-like motif domain-containing protein n=1 Tax=Panagrellus redivivus TaxID=6233 RepID=A0A7E4VMF5_PANRE
MLKSSQRPKNRNGNNSETSGDSGIDEPVKPVKYFGTDNYWIGQRIAEKKINTNTPNLRQYWEQNSLREQQEKQRQSQLAQNRSRRPFGFPKWRSNDAMTASLVASGKVPQLIPKDSQLPEHRKQKIEETERRAVAERQALQKSASNHKMQSLYKGKSMECLSMQVDYQPWYDRERIRSAISRESIGNIGAAKDRFERGDFPERDYRGGSSYALNNIDREPIRSGVTSAVPSRPATSMGKPNYAPPDVPTSQPPQISQNTASQNHQSHQNAQTVTMSPEHYAFLQYMRQNPNILSDFGIEVPKTLLNLSDNLQTEPETRQNTATPRQMAPVQPVAPTPHRSSGSGRYVKNGAGPRHHRRLYDVSVKQIPENKRQSMQDLDQQKAGDSLIAAEIRAIQEREDELRRSRSELGLPNLEDTLENWRTGHRLSSAVSTDAINHGFTHGYGSGRSLAASCDDLQWQQQQPYYERHYDGNSGYPMAGFDEQDEPASLTATSPSEPSLPSQPLASTGPSALPTTPAPAFASLLGASQQQQQHPVQHHEHPTLDVIDHRRRVSLSGIRRDPLHPARGSSRGLASPGSIIVSPESEPASLLLRSPDQGQDHGSPTAGSFKLFKSQDPDVVSVVSVESFGSASVTTVSCNGGGSRAETVVYYTAGKLIIPVE